MTNEDSKYFDLYTPGLGYLNRVREVTPNEGTPFWSVTIAALRGSADDARYTYFECRVSGKQAQKLVQQLKPAVEGKLKVLPSFAVVPIAKLIGPRGVLEKLREQGFEIQAPGDDEDAVADHGHAASDA